MASDLSGHLGMEIRDVSFLWHTLSLHWLWVPSQGSGSKPRSQCSNRGLLSPCLAWSYSLADPEASTKSILDHSTDLWLQHVASKKH